MLDNSSNRWSIDNQVYYLDGWAWGLSQSGRTYCWGKADEIMKEHPVEIQSRTRRRIATRDAVVGKRGL